MKSFFSNVLQLGSSVYTEITKFLTNLYQCFVSADFNIHDPISLSMFVRRALPVFELFAACSLYVTIEVQRLTRSCIMCF
jgi:hypothetical protein